MAPLSCLDSRMHACMLIVNAFMSHVFACISSMPTCMHVTCMICVYVPQQQEFAMLHRKVSMVEPMLPLPSLRPLRGPLPQPLCIVYITFFGRRLSSTTLADGTMVSVPVEKKSGYDKHDWQSSPKYPYDAWRGGVIDITLTAGWDGLWTMSKGAQLKCARCGMEPQPKELRLHLATDLACGSLSTAAPSRPRSWIETSPVGEQRRLPAVGTQSETLDRIKAQCGRGWEGSDEGPT